MSSHSNNACLDFPENKPKLAQIQISQAQMLKEIQYYVLEDLSNFIGMLIETLEVLYFFDERKVKQIEPYINVSLNRLITQTNISSAIHFDCLHRYENQKTLYMNKKIEALRILKHCLTLALQKYIQNPYVQNCIRQYLLQDDRPNLTTINLLKTDRVSDFNIDVVEKVFQGMYHVDQQKQLIKQGKYQVLNKQAIVDILRERSDLTKAALKKKFGRSN